MINSAKMNTLGIIGGMSVESTQTYYKLINRGVREHFGGLTSPPLVIASLDFAEIAELQKQAEWKEISNRLVSAGLKLKDCGADGLLIASNTMHKVAKDVWKGTQIEQIHIIDSLGKQLLRKDISHIGLLATKFTMEESFFQNRLKNLWHISCTVPASEERNEIHRIIFEELCTGTITNSSRDFLIKVAKQLTAQGVQAIALACTELGMLLENTDSKLIDIPILDTTLLHAADAVSFIINKKIKSATLFDG